MKMMRWMVTMLLLLPAVTLGQSGRVFHRVTAIDEYGEVSLTSVEIYLPGTTTYMTLYKDRSQTLPITQPITTSSTNTTLDGGTFSFWSDDSFDYRIKTAYLTQANTDSPSLDASANFIRMSRALALDTELYALSTLVSAANTFPYFTGSGTAALTGLDSAWRDILDGTLTTNANAIAAKADLHADQVIDVRDYGATGNGSTDDTTAISNAEAAADDNGGTIFFPAGDYELTDDLTISANVALQFAPGATISITTAKTLTIGSPQSIIGDPTQQIFVCNGTGKVAFTNGGEVSANWWGLSTSASAANNATYMNAALACGFNYTCDVAIYGSEKAHFDCGSIGYTNSSGAPKRGIRVHGVGRPVFDMSALTSTSRGIDLRQDITNWIGYSTILENIKIIGPEVAHEVLVTAFSDAGGGLVQADTTSAHGYSNSDRVQISGTTNYNGDFTITVVDGDSFTFPETWVADEADADSYAERSAWNSGTADQTVYGISAKWMLNLKLIDVEVSKFRYNFYAENCYVYTQGCYLWGGERGFQLGDDCTIGKHEYLHADTNYDNLILSGTVTNQSFDTLLVQNSGRNAITFSPGTGETIWGIEIKNPYLEAIDANGVALCQTTAGADIAGSVFGVTISGGTWSSITGSPIYGAVTDDGDVHGIQITNCTALTAPTDIAGYLYNSSVSTTSSSGATAIAHCQWGYDKDGRVYLPDDGEFNVQAYGAVGDGVADDTDEVQAAITAASASPYGIVYFPPGNYKITTALTNTAYVTLRGAGWYSSTITVSGAIWGITAGTYTIIEDLNIVGTATALGAIDRTSDSIGQINRCRIADFTVGTAIKIDGSFRQKVDHCYISACAIGLLVDDNTTTQVYNTNFSGCTTHAIDSSGTNIELYLEGCYFESNTGNITCDFTPPSNARVVFAECGFEDNGGSTANPMLIYHDGPWPLKVRDCQFGHQSATYTGTMFDLYLFGGRSEINGCLFVQNAAATRKFIYGLGTNNSIYRHGNAFLSSDVAVATLFTDYLANSPDYPPMMTIVDDRFRGSGGNELYIPADLAGGVTVKNGATSAGYLDIYEDSDSAGGNYARVIGEADITANTTYTFGDIFTAGAGIQSGAAGTDGQLTIYSEQGATDYSVVFNPHAAMTATTTYTLPPDDGDAGEMLTTNGSGALTWTAAAGTGDMTKAVYDVADDGFVDGNDTAYAASWNNNPNAPSMNAVYDQIQLLGGDMTKAVYDVGDDGNVDGNDTAYGAGWDSDVNAPSKNAVYDAIAGLGTHDAVTFDPNMAALFYFSSGQVMEVNIVAPTNGRDDALSTSDDVYDFVTGQGYITADPNTHDILTLDPNVAAIFHFGATEQALDVNIASPTDGRDDAIPTSDDVYDFVTGQGYITADPNSHDAVTVTDSNTVDLTLSTQDILAALVYQVTQSVTLSEDASGLKADVNETYLGTLYSGVGHDHSGTYVESETDPVVGAINGIVKADGKAGISAASADTDYLVTKAVDLVATAPLLVNTGANVDNVLPGADADITFALDFTAGWDFGGASSLEIPNAAAPTVNAAGEVAVDTSGHAQLIMGDEHDTARVIAEPNFVVTFVIPDDGDWDSEAVPGPVLSHDSACTIYMIRATAIGSSTPTLTYNLEERAYASLNSAGTDVFAADVIADGDGLQSTSFNNASIAAGSPLFFTTGSSAESGTVTAVHITIVYRKNVN